MIQEFVDSTNQFLYVLWQEKPLLWSVIIMAFALLVVYDNRLRQSFLRRIDYPSLKQIRFYVVLMSVALASLIYLWYTNRLFEGYIPVVYPFVIVILLIGVRFRLLVGIISWFVLFYFINIYLVTILPIFSISPAVIHIAIALTVGLAIGLFIRHYQLSLGIAVEELRQLQWRTRDRLAKKTKDETVLKMVQKASLRLQASSANNATVYRIISEECQKLIKSSYAGVCLTNEEKVFSCPYIAGTFKSAQQKKSFEKVITQLHETILAAGRFYPLHTFANHRKHMEKLFDPQPADILIAPIKANSHPAAIFVVRNIGMEPFSEKDKQIIRLFAAHTGLVVQNAQHNAAMANLMKARDQFTSSISHELKTPLSTIKLYAQLLAEQDPGHVNEMEQKGLQVIDKEVDKLTSIINTIHDFGKIQSGKFVIEKKNFDLYALCAERVETMQLLYPDHTFVFTADATKGQFEGDKIRIDQVITNLLKNAANYSPPKTKITLKLTKGPEKYTLQVKDQGVGISEEDRKHLFEAFFRGSQENKSGHKGMGLGLYITKGIVEISGGTISVTSTLGKGTTFTITLPRI